MKQSKSLLLIIAAVLWVASSQARATIVYTTESSFVSAISSGTYYLNNFSDITGYGSLGGSRSYSGNGFSYTLTSPGGGLYGVVPGANGAISTLNSANDLLVTFTSGNVQYLGGLFFGTDDPGEVTPASITLTLSDATTLTYASGDFRGFGTSSGYISSLTVHDVGGAEYPTMDHFYVAAVPETAEFAIAGVGLLGLVYMGRMVYQQRRVVA